MIQLHDVTAYKSGERIFSDFDFIIAPDHNLVITGDNGSGKTTLLEIIAGTVPVAKGEIHYSFVTGEIWEERYKQRKDAIHYLPSDAALTRVHQPDLFYQQRYYSLGDEFVPSVKDFLGNETIARIKAFNFPATLSIDHLLELKITRLSNGQQKRLVILENLAKQIPKVLLLDYPFEALDRASRRDLIYFLEVISQDHSVQLIVSDHDNELPSIFNRKIVLKNQQVLENVAFTPAPLPPLTDRKSRNNSTKPNRPVVEVRDLTIRYGQTTIIDKLNWIINKGERWALAGKNGSGKTTLFSLIYADHPLAYSQEVFLFGKRRGTGESIWDIKNRISYVGPEQMTFLDPLDKLLTARAYILKNEKGSNAEKLNSLSTFFNAEILIDKPMRQMSSGELQLVFLIRSLLLPKELLLLDEPFRFLDPSIKERVNDYLQTHLDSETTLVLITHDEKDMERWGSKVLWLGS